MILTFDDHVDLIKKRLRDERLAHAERIRKFYADDMLANMIAIGIIGLGLYFWL